MEYKWEIYSNNSFSLDENTLKLKSCDDALSLAALEVVIITISGATIDDKVDIMTTLDFQGENSSEIWWKAIIYRWVSATKT